MKKEKNQFIVLTILSTALSLLGVLLYKLFPKMKKCCEEMKDKCCGDGKNNKCCS